MFRKNLKSRRSSAQFLFAVDVAQWESFKIEFINGILSYGSEFLFYDETGWADNSVLLPSTSDWYFMALTVPSSVAHFRKLRNMGLRDSVAIAKSRTRVMRQRFVLPLPHFVWYKFTESDYSRLSSSIVGQWRRWKRRWTPQVERWCGRMKAQVIQSNGNKFIRIYAICSA